MKSFLFVYIWIAAIWCVTGQNLKTPFDLLKSELEKKEAVEASLNSVYWQNSAASLIRYSSLGHGTIQTFDTRYEGVKGTPYLYEDWQKGAIMVSGVVEPQPALINYDCVNGQLLVRLSDGSPAALPVEYIPAFLISDPMQSDGFAFFVSDSDQKGNRTFYKVIYNEKTILYQHLKKHFKPADYQRAYNPDRRFDSFEWEKQYFIKTGNTTEKIKSNPKSILKFFPGKEKEINRYLSENKINIRNEEEIIRLLEYSDSL